MHARLTTVHFAPDKIDEAIRLWQDSVVPAAKQQTGFKGARLLVNRQTGTAVSMGLWETEADALATGATSAYKQAQLAKFASLFTAPPVIETYEVGAEA